MGERITGGRLTISVDRHTDGDLVTLNGLLDEKSGLLHLAPRLGPRVTFDLEGLSFMNSVGLRDWVRLLAALSDRGAAVTLRRCSESMVVQMNMIVAARATAAIESFFAPYQCSCGTMDTILIDVATHLDTLRAMQAPPAVCPSCQAAMELAAIPEGYFLFLES